MSPAQSFESMPSDILRQHVSNSIAAHKTVLSNINTKIHQNPELRYQEYQAHDNICDLMESLGYSVIRHAHGLETSFEVESGREGRLIVFNAEYDALPGVGHACGHNLIATGSIAAFIATAEAIERSNMPGRVRLLGTPAEESGGGKIKLIKAGAYQGVDACLMAHPGPSIMRGTGKKDVLDGISAIPTLARKQVSVTFKGKNAHAGYKPWVGRNALDAVVASYVNISLLRQQIPPTARVHGVIRQGGAEPNIIPDNACLEYYIRDSSADLANELATRVEKCFEAGALATGCSVECVWDDEADYKDLRTNMRIAETFTEHMTSLGRKYLCDGRADGVGASTDMGNVSYEVPGFHCMFSVGDEVQDASPHTPQFAAAAATNSAFERIMDCAQGMAMTAYDILTDDDLFEHVRTEFAEELGWAGVTKR